MVLKLENIKQRQASLTPEIEEVSAHCETAYSLKIGKMPKNL